MRPWTPVAIDPKRLSVRRIAGAAAIALAAATVAFDSLTWTDVHVSVTYILALVLAAITRRRALVWGLFVILGCAAFLVYARQVPDFELSLQNDDLVDRIVTVSNMFVTAILVHMLIGAFDALDRRGREAEEASRRKTQLLASVAHDLHTPLTTINLIAHLIHGAAGKPKVIDRLDGLAADLQRSAAALSDMVTNAFDMAHLETGLAVAQDSDFALDALFADECRALTPLAEAKQLEFRCAISAAAPIRVRADRVKLARVIRNLVSNAIKFTDAGGVTIDASLAADGSLRIRVSDTGIGIDPADLERIFDEFERAGAEGDDGRAGWGLGLTISRRLLALMDGTVTAERRPEGGSVFTVTLPAARVLPAA